VHGSGEHTLIAESAVHLKGLRQVGPDAWLAISIKIAEQLAELAAGAPYVVETTPTNFFHVGLIARLLPRARIVHCVRNPLDTCLSIYQHPLSKAHDYAHEFENLASFYLNYRRLMDHWQDLMPGRIYHHNYEATVQNFEPSVRSLLNYCGLNFHRACLEFHKTERVIRTPSASQVRTPLYSSSVGRWRRYEAQLAPLKQLLEKGLGETPG
jgi:hypothetical protein